MTLQIPRGGRLTITPPPPGITPDIVAAYRPRAPELARRIAAHVCKDVAAFRDPRLRDHITESIDIAVALFIDALAGAPVRGTSVASLYQHLGELEARAGHHLDAMRAAHHIATQECLSELRAISAELQLPETAISQLTASILDYQQQLLDHALAGFAKPCRVPDARAQLFRALVSSGDVTDLQTLAAPAGWTVPERLAVAVTEANCSSVTASLVTSTAAVLTGTKRSAFIVIGPPADVHARAHAIAAATGLPIAVSWDVEPDLTHHAVRWGLRTLQLVANLVIEAPADGVIWCAKHQSDLCLHADPELRRCTDQQILAPLLGLPAKRRAALAETLLVWLQTGQAAPAVAGALHIHERTVRVRLRQIKDLFGDRLNDPTQVVGLLSALESMTPRWRREAA